MIAASLVLAFAASGIPALTVLEFTNEADCKAVLQSEVAWATAREAVGMPPLPFPITGMKLVCMRHA